MALKELKEYKAHKEQQVLLELLVDFIFIRLILLKQQIQHLILNRSIVTIHQTKG